MKKSTKGAFAAGVAGVLLLGGAGSLAYWSADAPVTGDTISSGTFTLTELACDTTWTLDDGEATSGAAFTPSTDKIVPGDVLTKQCTYTVGATGSHLRAVPTVTTAASVSGSINDTPASAGVTVAGTFTDEADAPVTEITEDNDGDVLTAKITMTFPLGTAVNNDSQAKQAVLSNYQVTLDQVHS